MQKQAWAYLFIGFAVGFAIFYPWTKQRAPAVVRALPLPVDAVSAQQVTEPPPPPLDTARLAQLQAEVKRNPQNFEAFVELGNIHFDQKNYEDAINFYGKALALRPDVVNVRTDLGTALFYDNRYDEAIAQFKKSLELNPTHPQTLFNLGVALLHGKNDPQGALEYWEKLVASNPNYPQAAFVKEQIRLLKEQQNRQ